MKAQNVLKLITILIVVVGINITGCKKDRTKPIQNPDTSSLLQLSKDDAQVQASDDEITNDANSVLSSTSSKSIDTTINSCTITIDTIGALNDTLRISLYYDGYNTGGNFKRTGTVIITKPLLVPWKDAGCEVTYRYLNLSVEKISTGKTFTFNGTRTWTNVSGGLIKNLNGSTTITYTITGAMQITFDDGTQRIWNISRQIIWGGTLPYALTATVSGFGSAAGYNNLEEYGTNRKGEAFYTQINTPILYSEICSGDPIWGQIVYQIPSVPKSATITFGYNSSDVLVSYGSCAENYKLDWVVKTNSGTIYLSIP
ncbi:MAG: hypothetical protein ABR968_00650 [Bacteroidales bacterium]|jgi:hypothetical protein